MYTCIPSPFSTSRPLDLSPPLPPVQARHNAAHDVTLLWDGPTTYRTAAGFRVIKKQCGSVLRTEIDVHMPATPFHPPAVPEAEFTYVVRAMLGRGRLCGEVSEEGSRGGGKGTETNA